MQNVGGRKKYLASTYPKKKNSWGIKGLKKKFMPIPNHPTPPSDVKWLAPKYIKKKETFKINKYDHKTS